MSLTVIRPMHRRSSSTTSSFSIRRWWSRRRASSWVTPGPTVTRSSRVISSETGWLRIFGEADVAVGEDADQAPAFLGHRDAGDPVARHQLERVGEGLVGRHGDRIDDHAAFVALHRADRGGLLVDLHVAVEDAEAAELRHDDRHVGAGHRVHRRGEYRDVERDLPGHPAAGVGLARQHGGLGRPQQHVVEGEAERDVDIAHRAGLGGRR